MHRQLRQLKTSRGAAGCHGCQMVITGSWELRQAKDQDPVVLMGFSGFLVIRLLESEDERSTAGG